MKATLLKIAALSITLLSATPAFAQNPTHINQLIETNLCAACDLAGADLSGAHLIGADLRNADLCGANPHPSFIIMTVNCHHIPRP